MPRRATLTYSSEDAPALPAEQLFVYYCKYSGRHALTTDCDLSRAPRRRTDNAIVVDTNVYTVRLYTSDGGVKVVRRPDGALDKQHRLVLGKLPIAYRAEEAGRYLYVVEGALTSYSAADRGGDDKPPVPPCILAVEDGGVTQVALEVDDRADRANLVKISADYVRVQVTGALSADTTREELLDFFQGVLGCRLAQLDLARGESARHKLLLVTGVPPEAVFEKLQASLQRTIAAAQRQ